MENLLIIFVSAKMQESYRLIDLAFNWPTAFLTKKLMVVLHFTLQVACIAVIDLSNARPRSQRRSEDYGGRHQLRKEGTKDSDVSVCSLGEYHFL